MEGDKETFVSGARTRHFNPLPPHGGRPGAFSCATMTQNISIHSLRMEGDIEITVITHVTTTISIHSLRMEGDIKETPKTSMKSFQSTPSAWRETYVSSDAFAASHISIHSLRMEGDRPHPRWTQFRSHFNPLPPHGGRHWIDGFFDKFAKISIHSLRMEGDYWISVTLLESFSFQSTPSAWRETGKIQGNL